MIANRSIPQCTVIPQLAYPDVTQAANWLCEVFGFTLRVRIGSHRAQLNVGDGAVVITEQARSWGKDSDGSAANPAAVRHASLCSVMVRVEDVDGHCEKLRGRVQMVRPPTTYPYGERQYSVEDFAGRVWTFSQSVADVRPEDWGGESGQL